MGKGEGVRKVPKKWYVLFEWPPIQGKTLQDRFNSILSKYVLLRLEIIS